MAESISRRRWLRSLLPVATEVVADRARRVADRRLPAQRRPPGAVGEAAFLSLCTRCGKCQAACEYNAVFVYAEDEGVQAGTPVMAPDERACFSCDGFPCAAACPDGALVAPTTPLWKLGTVRVATDRCMTFRGPECGACAGLCPPEAPALRLRRCRPVIDPDLCVGCGRCIHACPTLPSALELLPLPE